MIPRINRSPPFILSSRYPSLQAVAVVWFYLTAMPLWAGTPHQRAQSIQQRPVLGVGSLRDGAQQIQAKANAPSTIRCDPIWTITESMVD